MFDPDDMPKWIQNIVGTYNDNTCVIAGVNDDDCAIVRNNGSISVVTTDFINANTISEQLGIGTYKDLGALVVKNNLSDLCGSGAKAEYILLGVCLERGCTDNDFKDVIIGAYEESNKYGIEIIGGDSKLGRARSIYGIAIGSAKSNKNLFVKKRGKIGDDIWVSGIMGCCAAGTIIIKQKEDVPNELIEWAKLSVLNPSVPIDKSAALSETSFRKSGVDVSDGLAHDISTICDSSDVAAIIDTSLIPIDENLISAGKHIGIEPWLFAFALGGDMQFLVTASSSYSDIFKNLGFIKIGNLCEGNGIKINYKNTIKEIDSLGHRDSRGVSFYEEAKLILSEIIAQIEG